MNDFALPSLSLPALLASAAANSLLFVALGMGFVPAPASTATVVELPSVTVHAKRLSASGAVLADAAKKITLACDDKL